MEILMLKNQLAIMWALYNITRSLAGDPEILRDLNVQINSTEARIKYLS